MVPPADLYYGIDGLPTEPKKHYGEGTFSGLTYNIKCTRGIEKNVNILRLPDEFRSSTGATP